MPHGVKSESKSLKSYKSHSTMLIVSFYWMIGWMTWKVKDTNYGIQQKISWNRINQQYIHWWQDWWAGSILNLARWAVWLLADLAVLFAVKTLIAFQSNIWNMFSELLIHTLLQDSNHITCIRCQPHYKFQ